MHLPRLHRSIPVVAACLAAACGPAGPPSEGPTQSDAVAHARPDLSAVALEDLQGGSVATLPTGDARARVFVFVRSDCPIANRYAPEIARLRADYAARGVEFFLVYPDPLETSETVREHLDAFAFGVPALFDPDFGLTHAVGAEITPEAAVLTPDGAMPYRGRIDDRYPEYGVTRPEPTRRDLRVALDAVLAGRAVERPRVEAVGCYLEDLQR